MLFHGIKRKKIIIILMIFFTLIFFVTLVYSSIKKYNYEVDLQIDDANGIENKQLCYITNEKIEATGEDYRNISCHVNRKGNSSGAEGIYEEDDSSYVETKIKMMSGIYVCNAYLGDGRSVTYTIDSKVNNGNFRIVITNEENKILYDVPIDTKHICSIETEKDMLYYVKFIGESANVSVIVERDHLE